MRACYEVIRNQNIDETGRYWIPFMYHKVAVETLKFVHLWRRKAEARAERGVKELHTGFPLCVRVWEEEAGGVFAGLYGGHLQNWFCHCPIRKWSELDFLQTSLCRWLSFSHPNIGRHSLEDFQFEGAKIGKWFQDENFPSIWAARPLNF